MAAGVWLGDKSADWRRLSLGRLAFSRVDNANFTRSLDSDLDLIAARLEDGDLEIVADGDSRMRGFSARSVVVRHIARPAFRGAPGELSAAID